MMNSQSQQIQKREIVDVQIIKYKYKIEKNVEPCNLIKK